MQVRFLSEGVPHSCLTMWRALLLFLAIASGELSYLPFASHLKLHDFPLSLKPLLPHTLPSFPLFLGFQGFWGDELVFCYRHLCEAFLPCIKQLFLRT